MAVHDLSDVHANRKTLRQLVDKTLKRQNVDEWTALTSGPSPVIKKVPNASNATGHVFYRECEAVVGDCLAGETFESLWWIGVPSFLLTMTWWNWNYIRKSPA